MDLKKLIPALWRLEGGKEGDSLVKGNDGILEGSGQQERITPLPVDGSEIRDSPVEVGS